ncbi:MAG: DUF2608 domain-containing protein [Candidatus Rickettsia vulgarisii]
MNILIKFITSGIVFLLPLITYGEIKEINDLKTISEDYLALKEDYYSKDILVVLELKKVIFKPVLPELEDLSKGEVTKLSEIFKSIKPSSIKYFDTVVLTEYNNQLLDSNLPNIIKNIQESGSSVIVVDNSLTGNFNNIDKLEIWKVDYLKKFNIDLSSNLLSNQYLIFNNIEPFDNTYPTFYNGILTTNNSPIYQMLLNLLIEVKYMPKLFIMISSEIDELNSMETQLQNYNSNIAFIGYHLTSGFPENSNDTVKLLNELAKKIQSVKRNNPKLNNKDNIKSNDKK